MQQWLLFFFLNRVSKIYLCFPILFISVIICLSCAQHPAAQQRAIHYTHTQWHKPAITTAMDLRIDFLGACQLAAGQSEPLSKLLMQRDLSSYDIEQADSEVWPRLEVQAAGQIPLGDTHGDRDSHVRGGLYLRYDFHKALFRADAVATARAIKDKQFEKAKGQIFNLSYHLLALLIDMSIQEKQLSVCHNMVSQAEKGRLTAQKLYELRLNNSSVVLQWDSIQHLHQQKLQNTQYALFQTKNDLKFMLGLSHSQNIIVTDFDQIISKVELPFDATPDDPQFLTALLNRLPQGRVAINDLFLSEMAIVNAKRQRLPRLSGSIGVGRFDAISGDDEDDESPGTLELQISMPFLDWGDVRRDVNKAERQKSWAQSQIKLLAHRLHHDLVAGQKGWQHTKTISQQSKQIWQTMSIQAQENLQLLAIQRIQPLDATKFQLETYNAQIEYLESIRALYRSAATLKKRLGIPLVENLHRFIETANKPGTS